MSNVKRKLILLGKAIHNVSGELILKGENVPRLGDRVYDKEMKDVGYVSNIFGPVNSFYISVKLKENIPYEKGSKFFIME